MTGLPTGACDCHAHVIGDPLRYPMRADRQYTPGPASAGGLQAHMRRLGLQRVVIVQPSVYGTDNSCLLDSLAFFEGRARGVAVVDEDTDANQLTALHMAGVRGLRLNHESSGKSDSVDLVASLRRWADRIGALPWHLQVYASLDALAEAAPSLASLGVPVVLDHFGMTSAGTPEDDPRLQRLLGLLRTGMAYIKLSAAYRIGGQPEDALRLARLFIEANPRRVLWASDWPHTNREPGKASVELSAYRRVPADELAAQLERWAPDESSRSAMLSDNPANLYGFDS